MFKRDALLIAQVICKHDIKTYEDDCTTAIVSFCKKCGLDFLSKRARKIRLLSQIAEGVEG